MCVSMVMHACVHAECTYVLCSTGVTAPFPPLLSGQIHCSRYVNQHMVQHNEESHHPLALSFSDLSVWCYSCDDYIHNEVGERGTGWGRGGEGRGGKRRGEGGEGR